MVEEFGLDADFQVEWSFEAYSKREAHMIESMIKNQWAEEGAAPVSLLATNVYSRQMRRTLRDRDSATAGCVYRLCEMLAIQVSSRNQAELARKL